MKHLAIATSMILAALVTPRAAAAYDLCNQADRDEVAAETAGVRVDSLSDDPVIPGSTIAVYGEGFDRLRRFTGDLDLHVRFLSLEVPPGESKERWVAYSQRSYSIHDDRTIFVDVPAGIHGSRASLSIESDLPTRCERSDGTVWYARNFGFGWIGFDLAPADPQVEAITDLRATLLATRQVRLDWTDIDHERRYTVAYRRVGSQAWNGINWLGGPAELPAGTTSVTFDVSRLEPPEAYEFSVQSSNHSSSATSNVVGLDARSGEVTVLNNPLLASTLCDGTYQVSQISAFFDQVPDGLVAGFSGNNQLPFPRYPVVDLSLPRGYWNEPGLRFASAGGLQANLIVAAQFYGCGFNKPHFVAIHAHVATTADDRLLVTPILLLAGDELNEITIAGGDPIRGVIMNGASMDIGLDSDALLDRDRAVGSVSGLVDWISPGSITYGAGIAFSFDVPVQTR